MCGCLCVCVCMYVYVGVGMWGVVCRYYKGLGTSTAQEARAYFSQLDRHLSSFRYGGPEDDHAFLLAFDRTRADERKAWMLQHRYAAFLCVCMCVCI
jgi:hypothetical protein